MTGVGAIALPLAGAVLALLAAGAAALSGPGYRWEWWSLRQAFAVLRWAAYLGTLGGAVSLAAAIRTRPGSGREGFVLAVAGFLVGGGLCAWSLHLVDTARRVPAIHDISTDTANPPEFVAVTPLRAPTDNPVAYGGPPLAEQQRRGYPDIEPLLVPAPPTAVFRRAARVARDLGWTIVAEDESAGRIEASDRTPWYGFVDDLVVRIAAAGAGTRVDVRSASRIGKSDIGMNARRIRRFLGALARRTD